MADSKNRLGPIGIFGTLIGFGYLAADFFKWALEWPALRAALKMADLGQAVEFFIDPPQWMTNPFVQVVAIVIALGLVFWDTKRPQWLPSPELSQRQMIIGGLIVVMIGVAMIGYGAWKLSPPTPAPAASSSAASPQNSAVSPQNQPPAAKKPSRNYDATDAQRLKPLLQKASDLVDLATPLTKQLTVFNDDFPQLLKQGAAAEAITRLNQLKEAAKTVAAGQDDLQAAGGYYQVEVNYLIDAPKGNVAGGLVNDATNMARWISAFNGPTNDAALELIQNVRRDWDQRIRDFSQWTDGTRARIQELRVSLDAAGIGVQLENDALKEKSLRYARQWKALSDDIYAELTRINSQRTFPNLPPNFQSLSEEERNRIWQESTGKTIQQSSLDMGRLNQLFDSRIQKSLDEMAELGITPDISHPKQFRAVNPFGYNDVARALGSESLKLVDKYNNPQ